MSYISTYILLDRCTASRLIGNKCIALTYHNTSFGPFVLPLETKLNHLAPLCCHINKKNIWPLCVATPYKQWPLCVATAPMCCLLWPICVAYIPYILSSGPFVLPWIIYIWPPVLSHIPALLPSLLWFSTVWEGACLTAWQFACLPVWLQSETCYVRRGKPHHVPIGFSSSLQ